MALPADIPGKNWAAELAKYKSIGNPLERLRHAAKNLGGLAYLALKQSTLNTFEIRLNMRRFIRNIFVSYPELSGRDFRFGWMPPACYPTLYHALAAHSANLTHAKIEEIRRNVASTVDTDAKFTLFIRPHLNSSGEVGSIHIAGVVTPSNGQSWYAESLHNLKCELEGASKAARHDVRAVTEMFADNACKALPSDAADSPFERVFAASPSNSRIAEADVATVLTGEDLGLNVQEITDVPTDTVLLQLDIKTDGHRRLEAFRRAVMMECRKGPAQARGTAPASLVRWPFARTRSLATTTKRWK